MRIVVIGAGLAGLTTAWLLERDHQVTILEAAEQAGGHIASLPIEGGGPECAVDLGAQDFSTEVFALHAKLLDLLGLTHMLLQVPMTATVCGSGRQHPLLVTPHQGRPTILGNAWEALAVLIQAAKQWESNNVPWDVPFADLVDPLPVSDLLKHDLLYAQPSAVFGCSISQVREVSARAATALYTRGSAPPPGQAPVWQNLNGGLQTLVRALTAALTRSTLRVGNAVHRIARNGDMYQITTLDGRTYIADQVVMALPPPQALPLVEQLVAPATLKQALGNYRYVPVKIGVHLDPTYQPKDPTYWSTSNITVSEDYAESSAWYAPINGVNVFKSQITHRTQLPDKLLATADFQQMLPEMGAVRAQPVIARHQGDGGLWFAGHYTNDLDCQETAVGSAVSIAQALAPQSQRLRSLAAPAINRLDS